MHFYPGTTITYWRHQVSTADVCACLRAITRLQARESLLAAQRIAVGTGSLGPAVAGRIMRQWQREAGGATRRTTWRDQLASRET